MNPTGLEQERSAEDNRRTARQLAATFAFTGLALACLQSQAFTSWIYDLPPSLLTDAASAWAEQWNEQMEQLGIAEVTRTVEGAVDAVRALSW